MPLCKDPITKLMNDKGYSGVRYPRAGIRPGELIGRQAGTSQQLGPMSLAFDSTEIFPDITAPEPAAEFEGKTSSTFKIRLGLSFLDEILKFVGSGASVRTHYERAEQIEFGIKGVTTTAIVPLAVDRWLDNADLREQSALLSHFVEGDGQLYIITRVLRSTKLRIHAIRDNNEGFAVNLPSIRNVIGGDLTVDGSSNKDGVLTFESDTPAVFGFQAMELEVRDGRVRLRNAPHKVTLEGAQPEAPPEPIFAPTLIGDRVTLLAR